MTLSIIDKVLNKESAVVAVWVELELFEKFDIFNISLKISESGTQLKTKLKDIAGQDRMM